MQVAVDYLRSCAALSQGSIGAMSIDILVPPNTGGILPLSGACDFRRHVGFVRRQPCIRHGKRCECSAPCQGSRCNKCV